MGELELSQDHFNNHTMLLSVFGISDLEHQFWPLLYGIVQGENNTFYTKMIDLGQIMFTNIQLKIDSLLSDLGTSIISCTNKTNWFISHASCIQCASV